MPDTGGPSIYLASLKLADPSGHYQLGAQVAARQQEIQLQARAQAFKETMSMFDTANQAAQQIVKNRQIGVEQDQAQQRIDNSLVESQQRLEMTRQHQMAQEQYWKNGRSSSATQATQSDDPAFSGNPGSMSAKPAPADSANMPAANNDAPLLPEDAANLQKNEQAFKAQYGHGITDVEGYKQAMNQGDAGSGSESALGMMEGYAAMQKDAQQRANQAAEANGPDASLFPNLKAGSEQGASDTSKPSNAAVPPTKEVITPVNDGLSSTEWKRTATNSKNVAREMMSDGNGGRYERNVIRNPKTGEEKPGTILHIQSPQKGKADYEPPAMPKAGEPPVKGMETGGVYHGNGIGTFEYDADNSHYVQQLKWNRAKGTMEPNGTPKKTRTQMMKAGELPDPITNGDYTSYPIPTSNGGIKWETHRGSLPPPDAPKEGDPPVAGMAPGDTYFEGGTGVSQFDIDGNKFYQMKKWDDAKGRMVPDGQAHKLPEPKPEPGKLPENITVGDSIGVAVPDSSGRWKYKFYKPEPDVAAKISAAKAQGFDIAGYTVSSNGNVSVRAVAPKNPLTVAGAPDDLLTQIKGITGTPKNYIMQANATLYDASKYVNPQTGEPEPQPNVPDKLKALGRDPANPGTVTEEDWNKGYQLAMQARREQAAKTINNTIASLKGGVAKGAQWYLSHADAIINGAGASPMPTDTSATSVQPESPSPRQPTQQPTAAPKPTAPAPSQTPAPAPQAASAPKPAPAPPPSAQKRTPKDIAMEEARNRGALASDLANVEKRYNPTTGEPLTPEEIRSRNVRELLGK